MSLKAKIEAVIYASEEPVTLAQLSGLLGIEAQVELDRLASAQHSLALDGEPAAKAEPSRLPETANQDAGTEQAAGDEDQRSDEAPPKLQAVEPQPTDTAPDSEPEPTEYPPVEEHPEHNVVEVSAAPQLARENREQKNRERRLREFFRSILDELIAEYAASDRGLEIREVAGGFRFSTKPEYHDAVRGFVKSLKPPLKLSLQALETLAVVAYKQPVTGPEISEIRGVDSGGVLGSLMARKLITTAGRKQVIGRPILYRTTKDFLLRFGLKDVSELPSIEEFEKMAGELTDAEPIQEEISMPQGTSTPAESVEQEKNAVEPQPDGTNIPLAGTDESSAGSPGVTAADEVLTDGRISGLPPAYDQETGDEAPFDSPAMDAELQREEAGESVSK